ncbi:MAG TPA: hypothetical protein VLC09_18675 [Polyangiaceae bacterium]|nr:hypothetical protein [Polyangiaceae bacterium]
MTRQRWGFGVSAWVAGTLVACAGTSGLQHAFEPDWQWDHGQSAQDVLGRLRGKAGPARRAAVVGVTGPGLSGRLLPDGSLWTYEGPVDVLPSIVGDVVGFSGGSKLTLLDVATGQQLFSIESGGRRLEGMGYDGESVVLLLVDEDDARPDLVQVVSKRGQILHGATTLEHVGTPAALGGVGFVPWSNQYVSVFDLKSGQNLGRVLVHDATNRATAEPAGILLFGQGVVALDERLAQNPDLPSLKLPQRELPGGATWPPDGSKPRPVRPQSAAISARPVLEGSALGFAGGVYAASYFDIALGLEASSGRVRWATHFERGIVGAEAGLDALALCLEDGTLFSVSLRDGQTQPTGTLDSRLRACVVSDAPSFGGAAVPVDTDRQILEAVTGTGANMAAMHAWLVDELGSRPGSPATAALLEIARDPLISTPVVDRAGKALGQRSEGAEVMIQALDESAPPWPPVSAAAAKKSGITATPKSPPPSQATPPTADAQSRSTRRPPPIVALARALASMNEPRAAGPLARHLLAPSISTEQAVALLDALERLGGPAECGPMLEFFRTYRAAGGEPEFLSVLARAGRFVLVHGNAEEHADIVEASRDRVTHPELRKQLDAAVRAAPAPAQTSPAPSKK